jgi:hypothetical protein
MGHSRRIDGLWDTSAAPPIAPGKRTWRHESYGPRLCEKARELVSSNERRKLSLERMRIFAESDVRAPPDAPLGALWP